jgi:hypothetical protein
MTAALTVHCDHYGERIEAGRNVLRVETGPARNGSLWSIFAPGCFERFAAWLRQGVEHPAPAVPTPP